MYIHMYIADYNNEYAMNKHALLIKLVPTLISAVR